MQQAVAAQPVAGAIGKPGDRLLILVGHDTNLAAIAGALNLNWLIDGRRDDTPPGGALVFELWKTPGKEEYSVRTYYTAQSLDQMRNATPLSLQNSSRACSGLCTRLQSGRLLLRVEGVSTDSLCRDRPDVRKVIRVASFLALLFQSGCLESRIEESDLQR